MCILCSLYFKKTPTTLIHRYLYYVQMRPRNLGMMVGLLKSEARWLENRKINFLFFFVFGLFRAVPAAYGSSQAMDGIGACICWPTPQPQQFQIQAASATYTTGHGNARSLTLWVRPGTEPASSWVLVRFVSTGPRQELLILKLTSLRVEKLSLVEVK